MTTTWHSHLSGKLALAQSLLRLAQCYQQRSEQPGTTAQLAQLIGEDAAEVRQLTKLQTDTDNWWRHPEQLDQWQSRPAAAEKRSVATI